MCVVFAYRGAVALLAPGLGFEEAYIAGGLLIAGWLIRSGLVEWRTARKR
jgi:hypothetical protein